MNLKSRISSFYSGIKENRTEYAEEKPEDAVIVKVYTADTAATHINPT